jgi:hypothetical protein
MPKYGKMIMDIYIHQMMVNVDVFSVHIQLVMLNLFEWWTYTGIQSDDHIHTKLWYIIW